MTGIKNCFSAASSPKLNTSGASSRYNPMASWIFLTVSSKVSPWEQQPGKAGTQTENPPSGSCWKMALYCRTRWLFLVVFIWLLYLAWASGVDNDDVDEHMFGD